MNTHRENREFSKKELTEYLSLDDASAKQLFYTAWNAKIACLGDKVYLRGLIEVSNQCSKNCFYCGIRVGNNKVGRYMLSDDEILHAAEFAFTNGFGSIVLQSGENTSKEFVSRIEQLILRIKQFSQNLLGITLSLGEQSYETYHRWYNAGAHRYLLRIETSNKKLYHRLHPSDSNHDFDTRIKCLINIKEIGYQCGTGVMIGLPFQTIGDLADDLLFFKDLDVDMVGMGPYIEHPDTPLIQYENILQLRERLFLTFKMIALLRIMMPDINIAATTALQAIDPLGREKAIKIGANVLMPNITPAKYRGLYVLYNNKPCLQDEPEDCIQCLDARVRITGNTIEYHQNGNSLHFLKKQ